MDLNLTFKNYNLVNYRGPKRLPKKDART